jgi:hypothetical protein
MRLSSTRPKTPLTDRQRGVLGFLFGLIVMSVAVQVFVVNRFDFDNMARGTRLLLSGVNPWASATRIDHFYNPPFAALFLWPMLFVTPRVYLAVGGALLFAFSFYHRAWVSLAWFATNSVLFLVAAGGIDMFVVGAGLLLLLAGDRSFDHWPGLAARVLAYGLLLLKPQGTIFIIGLYLLLRRDWKGLLACLVLYGLPFLTLYPAWLSALIYNPPGAQTEATHTLWAKFGPWVAIPVALAVLVARRWRYWQLGGALAGILAPYGMPAVPIYLVLSGVAAWKAIPIVILWSACLAALTWVSPPPGVDYYEFISPRMAIYHLSMLGLALSLACLSPRRETEEAIAVGDWLARVGRRARSSAAAD